MSVRNALRSLCVLVALGLLGNTASLGLEVGLTFQAHQDVTNPDLWPNDFHITGLIYSPAYPPLILKHHDGPFTGFSWIITPTGDPGSYQFEASWWLPDGKYIPFCEIMRMGVLVDVDAMNIIIDVRSWWTRDGVPVGGKAGSLYNNGFYPVLGFDIEDRGEPQVMTLANGTVVGAPSTTPGGPGPAPAIIVNVLRMDVVAFDAAHVPDFDVLCEGCEQEMWPWVPVAWGDGSPISEMAPLTLKPDSAALITLNKLVSDTLRPVKPVTIERGGFLVVRQQIGFINNGGEYERRWAFEVHGSQAEEACCFPDGSCKMLQPFTCLEQMGTPMGAGKLCDGIVCGVAPDQGACCYGTDIVMCVVTDQLKCLDGYAGTWKGVGTNCDDVVETCMSTPPEACCFDGDCQMLDPKACVDQGGKPQGPGSVCVGDTDGDGLDETCEAKWMQPPDVDKTGIDVHDTVPIALADDFLCTEISAITRIVVWGSWLKDQYPYDPGNVTFTLSFREDIPDPDGSGPLYSTPGKVLWTRTCKPYSFKVEPYRRDIQEGYWREPADPTTYVFPGDTVCWMYTFDIPYYEAFCQQGRPERPIVYWLDVQATIPPTPLPYDVAFGWKTTTKHWNDDAVWQYRSGGLATPFRELRYPDAHPWARKSMDLAFALEGKPYCDGTLPVPTEK